MIIEPRNWLSFQHYKYRTPPWIRLHRSLLDDYEFHCLPIASKALAPCLWLLASEYQDGKITASGACLAFRLRMPLEDFMQALEPLKTSGFFSVYQDASELLADCEHDAKPEKSRVEKSRVEKSILCKSFDRFWDAFDYKRGRDGALKSWGRIAMTPELLDRIVKAAENEAKRRPELLKKGGTPKMAQGWLTDKRWEDETDQLLPSKSNLPRDPPKTFDQLREERNIEAMKNFAARMTNGLSDIHGGYESDGDSIPGRNAGDGSRRLLGCTAKVVER